MEYLWVQKYTTTIRTRKLYIRNPEIYEIGSSTKLFITFLSLRFFDMRRERDTYNFFKKRAAHIVDPNWSRLGETKNWLPSSSIESQLPRSEFKSQLTVVVFFKFKNPQRFREWRHSRPPSHFTIWGFYCDIPDCHIHPARVWTPALNVCT